MNNWKQAITNNLKSSEAFTEKLRSNLVKMLDKGRQITRFRSNCNIGSWEISQINRFMRIFPMVSITYSGKSITIITK